MFKIERNEQRQERESESKRVEGQGQTQLEIRVESITQRYITPIVDVERRLDKDVFAHFAKGLPEHRLAICGEGFRRGRVWEVGVVLVHEASGMKTAGDKFRGEAIVAIVLFSVERGERREGGG